jgi:hypothetical protein
MAAVQGATAGRGLPVGVSPRQHLAGICSRERRVQSNTHRVYANFRKKQEGRHAMGGELTALWFLVSMLDMGLNHCGGDGCLHPSAREPYLSFSAGTVHFQGDHISEEIYLRGETPVAYGPFHIVYGAAATTEGDLWAGIGASHWTEWEMGGADAFLQLSLIPGIYMQGDGPDLGGPVSLRAGIELGIEARNGVRYAISLDHRSHGGLYDSNPGLETVQLRVSIPLR